MSADLEQRFEKFLNEATFSRQLDGKLVVPDNVRLADYMLFENTILEMKSIKKDVVFKLKEKAHNLIDKDVVIYGDYQSVIINLPNGKILNNKIYNDGTRLLEGLLRKAKSQIESTMAYLDTDLHGGAVLILNDSLISIPYDGILNKLAELFHRTDERGNFKYQKIEKVILIQDIIGIDRGVYILNNSTTVVSPDTENSVSRMLSSWANDQRII
ncbi:hypothetical protein [Photobacterium damselae]|uniref:hypothetical protein n=1 Tax=Photobacterium damselae TaxID=38293 RepID=UPI001EDCE05A|nr:hypothetical protein [Photobacterium damselae]MCG3815351.1 hypothetical protein [Photobacterium damselae]